jgi:hypothetical protein
MGSEQEVRLPVAVEVGAEYSRKPKAAPDPGDPHPPRQALRVAAFDPKRFLAVGVGVCQPEVGILAVVKIRAKVADLFDLGEWEGQLGVSEPSRKSYGEHEAN